MLQFVQSLASPFYINYLASEKYFDKPAFIAYLNYLLYFTKPPYLKFLTYPGPTLRNLELLQNERFRTEILDPAVAMRFWLEGMEAAKEWPNKK
ncbi:mediator complex, subunit Med31 [Bisporella sp. PMI_857]|nr:mediator complex, subunit Med31 [Bisporella sp. PMI_857]